MGPKADIWAIGVMLHELFTGEDAGYPASSSDSFLDADANGGAELEKALASRKPRPAESHQHRNGGGGDSDDEVLFFN